MNTSKIVHTLSRTKFGRAILCVARTKRTRARIYEQLEFREGKAPTKRQLNWCFRDYCHFYVKYNGSVITDYFQTQMYRKSDYVRDESFATFARFAWRDAIQEKKFWPVFEDKREFYKNFSEYLERKWMSVDETVPYEKFSEFLQGKKSIFIKIPDSCAGKDVHLVPTETEQDKKNLYAQCMQTPMLIEEPIVQCDELAEFSDFTTVNTVRIVTIIDDGGNVHLAGAMFRVGRKGSCVDNYTAGGMTAPVDVDTGIVTSSALDLKGKYYAVHPESGKQIVGYKIPDWDQYVQFAKELAGKFPTVRYVGWDITMTKDHKLCVIEGNKNAAANVMECGLLYGLLPHYNKLLHMK